MFRVFWLTVAICVSSAMEDEIHKIPEDLLIGFASASYQIEGGWDDDGKSNLVCILKNKILSCHF